MKKKFLALVMTLAMVLSLIPVTALATDEDTNGASQEGSSASGDSGATTGSGDNESGGTGGTEGGTSTGDSSTPDTGTGTEGDDTGTGSGTSSGGSSEGGETEPTPETSENAAKIGGTEYGSLAEAINAATSGATGATIELLRDVKEDITISKSLTLDLCGFTLTGTGSGAVVTISGADTNVTITSSASENGTVVDGKITGGHNDANGGGVAVVDASVTMENLVITENTAIGSVRDYIDTGINKAAIGGGGVYARNATLSMNNVVVSKNDVTLSGSDGGGVLLIDVVSFTMTNSTVECNSAMDCGGGVYAQHSNLTIENSFVRENAAPIGAGINLSDGDDVAEANCRHTCSIGNSTISQNIASNMGGGMYLGSNVDVTINDSTMEQNIANDGSGQGGAIVAYSARTIKLDDVSISGNEAQNGAGIFALGTAVCDTDICLLNGTEIDKNTASKYGGGIYAYALSNKLNVTMTDSSINDNTAVGGAGIFIYKSGSAVINVNLQSGAVMHGNNATTDKGGAIYACNAAINIAAGSALYNNTAKTAGDDLLLNGGTFTLPNAKDMSGDRILSSDNAEITGWYHDGWYKWDSAANEGQGQYVEVDRWTADTADEYTPKENDTQAISLKAAHPKKSSSHHSHRDTSSTVTIPDGLNGADHYAYVVGYPDGLVYPQNNITRAEVATIFFRLLEDETREANMTKSNSYSDVQEDAWYNCAVSTLSKMGIIKGYEDGSFQPNAPISRAEFAAIAARFDPDGDTTPATFSDVSGHWAKDEISIAANHGWIKGYEDGSFKPDQKITRAETMTLVNRVLKRLPETKDDLHQDMKTWPDNQDESAWYYLAVQEATNSHYQNLKADGTHEKWESMRETRDWATLEK